MTYAGARGPTKSQMGRVLGFRGSYVHNAFRSTMSSLNRANGQYKLAIANRLFVQSRSGILKPYKRLLKRKYLAGVDKLDFAGNPSGAARFINKWVEGKTNKKIKNIVKASAVRNALLVLANAIYFKGFWNIPFHPRDTRPGTFYAIPRSKKVAMMHINDEFAYAKDRRLRCQILELPYKGKRLSMYVFLPNRRNGLKYLERRLNYWSVTKALRGLRKRKIPVTFPKFKMTLGLQLKKVLMAMGMKRPFNSYDFKGIVRAGGLRISDVIHKAFIQVDEKGTEAAAATVVVLTYGSSPTAFIADHPFLFLIKDKRTGSILFIGRLMNP